MSDTSRGRSSEFYLSNFISKIEGYRDLYKFIIAMYLVHVKSLANITRANRKHRTDCHKIK